MGGPSPCASCKLLRRGCATDCIFAPYFPSDDDRQKFAHVHKVFGASKVGNWLKALPFHQREEAVRSFVYEAEARVRDPVSGCVGYISFLEDQVSELEAAMILYNMSQAQIPCIQNHEADKGGKGKEAFEAAAGEGTESSDAAVKRERLTFDPNQLPSGHIKP